MSKLNSRFSRFSFKHATHKGKKVKDLISSDQWKNVQTTFENTPSNLAVVPNGMEGRPDLISNNLYGTPKYWWIICVANNISDPFEQLIAGKKIKIPIIK